MTKKKNKVIKLAVKDHWDYPQTYVHSHGKKDSEIGVFVGRKEEKEKLKDLFGRKSKGSILISGPRGIGKTSLVYRVIYELQEESQDSPQKILPIVLNASQLELKNSGEDKNRLILISLISQLSSTYEELTSDNNGLKSNLKNKAWYEEISAFFSSLFNKKEAYKELEELNWVEDMYQEIDNLYQKAIAKKWQLENTNESYSKFLEKNENSKTKVLKIDLKRMLRATFFQSKKNFLFLLSLPIASSILSWLILLQEIRLAIFSFLLVLTTEFVVTYKNTEISIKERYEKKHKKVTYQLDNSFSTLESQFQEVLKKLSKRYKVIFIIDELDKIQSSSDNKALDLIKTYKNLFTNSPGLFVFIGNKDLQEKVINPHSNSENNPYLTLFTDHVFLSVPTSDDLSSFYKEIIESNGKNSYAVKKFKTEWSDFQKFITYKAKGNFFLIIYFLKDFIVKEKVSKKLQIKIDLTEQWSSRDKAMSQAFKAIEMTYSAYYRKQYSAQSENHELLRELFGVAELLRGQGDTGPISLETGAPNVVNAKKDLLNNFLIPSGLFQKADGEASKYKWTKRDVELPDEPGPFKYEKEILDEYQQFENLMLSYSDSTFSNTEIYKKIHNDFGIDVSSHNTIATINEMKKKLRSGEHTPIENSEKLMEEIESLKNSVVGASLDAVKHRLLNLDLGLLAATMPPTTNLLQGIEGFTSEYQKIGTPISVLHLPAMNKQIIFINQESELLVKHFGSLMDKFESTYALVYLSENDYNQKNAYQLSTKPQLFTQINNIVESLASWVNDNSYVLTGKKGFVHSGMLSHLPEKTTFYKVVGANYLGSSTHSLIKIPITNFKKKIVVKAQVNLKDASIFNMGLVFYDSQDDQKWVFGRLDTRKPSPGNVDGILIKKHSTSWEMVEKSSDEANQYTDPNIDIDMRVTFLNNHLHLYKSNKKIASLPVEHNNLKEIILFNENENVTVKKISYTTK